jgi:phage gp36-like protein
MSYTDVEDVKKESGMQDNENISDEDVQDFIDTAAAIINSRLAGKYNLPFADQPATPQIVERIARGIASAYLLMQEYGPMNSGDAKDGDSKEKLMMKLLRELQKGETVVVDNAGVSMLSESNKSSSFYPTDASSCQTGGNIIETDGSYDSLESSQNFGSGGNGPYIRLEKKW